MFMVVMLMVIHMVAVVVVVAMADMMITDMHMEAQQHPHMIFIH